MADRIDVLARRVADGRRVLLGLMETELGEVCALDMMSIAPEHASPVNWQFARIIAATHADTLRKSDLYLADPDMCTLVDVAAPTMPDQVLRADDPITPYGLLSFAEPLPDRTGVGITVPIHVLTWALIPAGHPVLEERNTGTSILLTAYVSTAEFAATMGQPVPAGAPRYLPNSSVMWEIGTKIGEVFGEVPVNEPTAVPGFYQRVAAAFWTLAKQPLSETAPAPAPSNKERHRYNRAGIADPGKPVRVVSLRHRGTSSGAQPGQPSGRHVNVRFMVRGHWKRAYRPSVQAHRLVYVAPHVKGPKDAPLLGGEKVLLARGESIRQIAH